MQRGPPPKHGTAALLIRGSAPRTTSGPTLDFPIPSYLGWPSIITLSWVRRFHELLSQPLTERFRALSNVFSPNQISNPSGDQSRWHSDGPSKCELRARQSCRTI